MAYSQPSRSSNESIIPASAECSSALRLGATYCASSEYILARNSTGFFSFRPHDGTETLAALGEGHIRRRLIDNASFNVRLA
jgi:hypothetical protein